MCSELESLKIDLKGLKEGVTALEYDLDDAYFRAVEAQEVSGGCVHVTVQIQKIHSYFEIILQSSGIVKVLCDLCLDEMDQPIETDNRLVAKFGIESNNEDDEQVIVDENEGILDLSWFIYEFIALAIPIRHVHAPGKCNPAMMKALEEHSTDRSRDEESTDEIDPRWEKLKNLKI